MYPLLIFIQFFQKVNKLAYISHNKGHQYQLFYYQVQVHCVTFYLPRCLCYITKYFQYLALKQGVIIIDNKIVFCRQLMHAEKAALTRYYKLKAQQFCKILFIIYMKILFFKDFCCSLIICSIFVDLFYINLQLNSLVENLVNYQQINMHGFHNFHLNFGKKKNVFC